MLELILRKKGLQCIQCADGVEVVQLLEERGCDFFDLIFMDSVMPIMVTTPRPAQFLFYMKVLILLSVAHPSRTLLPLLPSLVVRPRQCGPEAARRLRSLGCGNLIVGVTGNAMDVDVLDYENCGADLVLTKPLRMDYLNRLLEYCDQHGCFSHHKRFIPEVRCLLTRAGGRISLGGDVRLCLPSSHCALVYLRAQDQRAKKWVLG